MSARWLAAVRSPTGRAQLGTAAAAAAPVGVERSAKRWCVPLRLLPVAAAQRLCGRSTTTEQWWPRMGSCPAPIPHQHLGRWHPRSPGTHVVALVVEEFADRADTGKVIELLSNDSQDALETLAEEPPDGPVLLLGCPLPELAAAAGRWIARHHLGPAADYDAASFAPSAQRWRVTDLEPVLARAARQPRRRHVLILEDADRLEQRSYDRLLKLAEEPPAPTLLVLTATATSQLPATLRGRAAADVVVHPRPPHERVAALAAGGVRWRAAEAAVDLAGDAASLAGPLARHDRLRDLASKALDGLTADTVQLWDIHRRLAALTDLAVLLDLVDTKPDATLPQRVPACSTPPQRAQLRKLVLRLADRFEHTVRAQLHAPQVAGQQVASGLDAIDRLRKRLTVPTPPGVALSALAADLDPAS